MSKYSIESPEKARARLKKEPPKPKVFIEVIEAPNARVAELLGMPFSALHDRAISDALKGHGGLICKKVEYFQLSVAPGPGLSWLREYRGMPSLYRQG